jgi:hypothetical protein
MKESITLKRFLRGRHCTRIALSLSLLMLWGSGAYSSALAGDAGIHAVLDQTEIGIDDQAMLTVTESGTRAANPEIPRIDGLTIIPAGQSSRLQSINGRITESVEFLYTVQAERTGTFTIPPISVSLNGTTVATEPLSLTVITSAASRSGRFSSMRPSAGRAVKNEDAREPVFLRVSPAKNKLYVGEVVPVEIMAFFKQGTRASVQAAPQLSGSAFSLTHHTAKPQQTQETINGEPYMVLTWHEALCAVKEGEYPLGTTLDVTVAVRDRGRRPSMSSLKRMADDDFFNDSFFDDFFSSTQEKEVHLESRAQTINVLALPAQGRPEGFTGAIGRFTLEGAARPAQVTVGDPVTLTLQVRGRGNFDRLALMGLANAAGWKTYAPSAHFKPDDAIGYHGVKEFEQAVIPKDASRHELPPVSFCYFDPDVHSYVTVRTHPLPISVEPAQMAAISASAPTVSPVQPVSSPGASRELNKGNPYSGLSPLQVEYGSSVDNLRPLLYRQWFLGMQVVPLLLLVIAVYINRRCQGSLGVNGRERTRRIRHAVKKSVTEMDRGIVQDDAQAFFLSCRQAIQITLGELWGIPPAAITLADIQQRLNGQGAEIRQVFETADAVAYSGRPLSQSEMQQCRDLLVDVLFNLENKTC